MKTKIFLFVLLTTVLCIILFSACFQTRPKVNDINPAFGKYISGYTSGMVSRKSTIRIELSHGINEPKNSSTNNQTQIASVTTTQQLNEALPAFNILPDSSLLNDAFTFEPAIKGRAVWINDRVIEFIPTEILPANQFYNVDFKLQEVITVDDGFENFKFQLSTFPQNVFVNIDGLRSYDDYNIEWQKLTGKITTSD